MNDDLEGGPWMIQMAPMILSKWSSTVTLSKEDLTRVSVWIKLHDVLLTTLIENGLSVLAS